ncbi:MAG: hypothetical protein ACLFQB_13690 [Chitinispirillaceae bacterium]
MLQSDMLKAAIICCLSICSLSFGQSEQDAAEEAKTIVEFVIDSSSADGKIPVKLLQTQYQGSLSGTSSSINFYSTSDVGKLPNVYKVPPGEYALSVDNNQPFGKANFNVSTDGDGYQKWVVIPGDSKKAEKAGSALSRVNWISSIAGTILCSVAGWNLMSTAFIGTSGRSEEELMESYDEHMQEYYDYQREGYNTSAQYAYESAQDDLQTIANDKKAEQKIKKKKNIAKYCFYGAGGCVAVAVGFSIPCQKTIKKNSMKVKLEKTEATAPLDLLQENAVEQ